MILNHKRRLENFIIQMNEKPVRIEEIDRRHKFRDEVPEKFLGGACFKFADFRYKTEKERIEENVEKNKELGYAFVS